MPDILLGVQVVLLERLTLDPTLQPRREMDPALIDAYAERMQDGDQFPPLIAYLDDADMLRLSEGWHRYGAARAIGLETLLVDIRSGDYRAAKLNSLASNRDHGLRRSTADKRFAIQAMLADPEWCRWSDSRIAQYLGVTHPTVSKYRQQAIDAQSAEPSCKFYKMGPPSDSDIELGAAQADALAALGAPPRLVERNGAQYEMDVSAIGQNPPFRAPSFTDLLAAAGANNDPNIQRARYAESLAVFLARWYENVSSLRTLEESVTATEPGQRWKLTRFTRHLREFADHLDSLLAQPPSIRVVGED